MFGFLAFLVFWRWSRSRPTASTRNLEDQVIFGQGFLPQALDKSVSNCWEAVLVLSTPGILFPQYPPYLVSIPLCTTWGKAWGETSSAYYLVITFNCQKCEAAVLTSWQLQHNKWISSVTVVWQFYPKELGTVTKQRQISAHGLLCRLYRWPVLLVCYVAAHMHIVSSLTDNLHCTCHGPSLL